MCTKHYQNRPRYIKDVTKKLCNFFWFTVITAAHLQNANAKVLQGMSRYTIQLSWKTLTFLYDKFTQDNINQTLSQSRFVDCISKTFWCIFSVHSVYS